MLPYRQYVLKHCDLPLKFCSQAEDVVKPHCLPENKKGPALTNRALA